MVYPKRFCFTWKISGKEKQGLATPVFREFDWIKADYKVRTSLPNISTDSKRIFSLDDNIILLFYLT